MAGAWLALAKDAIALFGGICLMVNVLLPIAALALQFAVFDAPELLARWWASRQQQEELARLAAQLERLETRRERMRVRRKDRHSEQDDAKQSARRPPRRRRTQEADEDALMDAKSALVSQAEATEPSESEPSQQQQRRRHHLSIYSTGKKPPRPRDASVASASGR
ncbi:hypothetical protein PybrP1_005439 [[Pythium] brassicae (nom. inval.)]|nr:hypothetical protein PybrP1_005439 [[Pythium] brassicae (nom. inval.)]